MIKILLVIHIIISLLLVISIFMQKTSADSISNLASNNTGLVSAKTAANFLTKATIVLAILFMVNCIILGNLSTRKSQKSIEIEQSIKDGISDTEIPIAK